MFDKNYINTRIFTTNDLKFNTKIAWALSITYNNNNCVGLKNFVKRLLRSCIAGSVRFVLVYHKCWITILKWTSFLSVQAMTLNRLEVNKFCEKKTQNLIEIRFPLQTRLSLLAMRVTFKTNVKSFGYHPANLTVFNTVFTGLQKKSEYPFQSLTNLEPKWCAEHHSVHRLSNVILVFP